MADVLTATATMHSLILRLAAAAVPTSLAALILSIYVVATAMQPRRGYFVPPLFRGVLTEGEVTEAYLSAWASAAAERRYVFNWKNLPHKQAQFQALLLPSKAQVFQDKTVPEELKLAKKFEVRSDFAVTQVDVLPPPAGSTETYRVLVHGLRSLWINGVVHDEEMTITFILRPFTRGGDPQGLQIVDYQGTPPLKVAGR